MRLCYPEEPKTLKTVWEYYNEGTLGVVYHITVHYLIREARNGDHRSRARERMA
jgi:hypothetical protein